MSLDREDRKQDAAFSIYTYSSSYWSKTPTGYIKVCMNRSQINRKRNLRSEVTSVPVVSVDQSELHRFFLRAVKWSLKYVSLN